MPAALPIGSTVTIPGLDHAYRVCSTPYPRPYSDPAVTLEAPEGYRFQWSLSDCIPLHVSYT